MAYRLQNEILQGHPFDSLEIEAFLSVMRTADLLCQSLEETLKAGNLSMTQYNVLRILRGARPEGLPCSGIAARMVTHDPDITRLLDRMEKRRLVQRKRGRKDRRVVLVTITQAGMELLDRMQEPVQETHRRQFAKVDQERLRQLVELLEAIRSE
jgi:DNA-binding MarR family transcriptional regulator